MKTVYAIVGKDIAVTESCMRQLKAAAHGMIMGNPDDVLVWRTDAIGDMAFYMTTDRTEAERFLSMAVAKADDEPVPNMKTSEGARCYRLVVPQTEGQP